MNNINFETIQKEELETLLKMKIDQMIKTPHAIMFTNMFGENYHLFQNYSGVWLQHLSDLTEGEIRARKINLNVCSND